VDLPMHIRPGYKAISFDLDDTLWEIGPVIVRAELAMHRFLAERYPRVTQAFDVAAMREVRRRIAGEQPAMSHDFTYLRLEALRLHAVAAGYAPAVAEEAFEVFYRVRNEVLLFDDVLPALGRLGQRYRLFTLSNGNADLAAIGIDRYFERSICARDAGALKPDARIFERLVDAAGVAPAEILHVGDDPEADVGGATSAGLAAAWIQRGVSPPEWPDDLAPPRLRVGTLLDLARALGL
jgi:FMN hydrolase / 5-amino-6-(5-phospho-D-ribitylamino)uracil phosphatase